MMLAASISVRLWAQSKEDKAFEVPENIVITSRFYFDLKNSNKMKIELSDFADLQRVANVDSLLNIFLQDISPLKDSLTDPLTSKRIDYITDAELRKKIRFRQTLPTSSTYLVTKGDLSTLRISQDTVNIIGIITNPPKTMLQKISKTNPHYYHFTFYLNDMNELKMYMNGMLSAKIGELEKKDVKEKWPTVLGTGSHYLKSDKSITADKPNGATSAGTGDMLTLNISVGVQNYKNYFVPSFSLGTKLTFSNAERTFKWEPGLFWEPQFLFARDAQDKLRTYRNDFLTLTYGQGGIKDHDPAKDFSFSAVFSLGYLINRNGDFYEKNTFRLGAGKINLAKTTIEPILYFNNFFKGVTPGIKISQYF